jgi:hypothetical protein
MMADRWYSPNRDDSQATLMFPDTSGKCYGLQRFISQEKKLSPGRHWLLSRLLQLACISEQSVNFVDGDQSP